MKTAQICFSGWRAGAGLAAFSAMLLAGAAQLGAQDLSWQDRGDRYEGVVARDISGGYFTLLGVQLEGGEQLQAGAARLQISFWLPSPQTLNIRVWEPRSNYWMIPHAKKFSAHAQSFAWPLTPVIRGLNLNLELLQVLVANENETLYFPARLSTAAPALSEPRYRFTFDSKGGVELEGVIVREAGKALQPLKSFAINEEYPGTVRVRWDGKDSEGRLAPEGVYRLQLKGAIYLNDSEEAMALDIRFMHRGNVEQ